ncbi:MAG: hypothetical protein QUS12_01160 [Methanosarcina sp.]|nr:hypothetical protein [Methanosarcina sp.]
MQQTLVHLYRERVFLKKEAEFGDLGQAWQFNEKVVREIQPERTG